MNFYRVKYLSLAIVFSIASISASAQSSQVIIFPDSVGWNHLSENQELEFQVKAVGQSRPWFSLEGANELRIRFDTLGNFYWKPNFDLVDRVTKAKDFTVIFQASFADGRRERKAITFTVQHVNRPPVVEDLPTFYVKQSNLNTYQIAGEYVYDPDGDPLVFKSIQSQMAEGSDLSSLGQFTWKPSRSQFSGLRNNPSIIEFIVQDQPDKAETGKRNSFVARNKTGAPNIVVSVRIRHVKF